MWIMNEEGVPPHVYESLAGRLDLSSSYISSSDYPSETANALSYGDSPDIFFESLSLDSQDFSEPETDIDISAPYVHDYEPAQHIGGDRPSVIMVPVKRKRSRSKKASPLHGPLRKIHSPSPLRTSLSKRRCRSWSAQSTSRACSTSSSRSASPTPLRRVLRKKQAASIVGSRSSSRSASPPQRRASRKKRCRSWSAQSTSRACRGNSSRSASPTPLRRVLRKKQTPSTVGSRSSSRSASPSFLRTSRHKKQTPPRAGSISPSRSASLSPPRRKSTLHKKNGYPIKESHLPKKSLVLKDVISNETLSALGSAVIPEEGFFERSLPKTTEFVLNDKEWQSIAPVEVQSGGRAFSGAWTHLFAGYLKQSNPFCSFVFKYNRVKQAGSRKKYTPFFRGAAKCKQQQCSVTAKMVITASNVKERKVTVTYGGKIRHPPTKPCSRFVSGPLRKEVAKNLKHSTPSKTYNSHLTGLEPDVFVSGNRDGVGSPGVLRKIASEGKKNELGDSIIPSILSIRNKQQDEDHLQARKIGEDQEIKRKLWGYVQYVGVEPLTIMMWTEAGVRLWHDLCSKCTVHWDATGSLVKKVFTDSPVYYYALVLPHPVNGEAPLAVAEMITNSHSAPSLSHFLSLFRHSEASIFGSSNVAVPMAMESDLSFPFILAALKEINGESFSEFLKRAWRTAIGKKAPRDMGKTNPHACTSHVMHEMANQCKKRCISGDQIPFILHSFALLVNCKSLGEAEAVVTNLYTVLMSPTVNRLASSSYKWLKDAMPKIGCKDFGMCLKAYECERQTDSLEIFEGDESLFYHKEESYLSKLPRSQFKIHFENLIWSQELLVQKACKDVVEMDENRYFAPAVMNYIQKYRLPNLPLWSGLMKGHSQPDEETFGVKSVKTDSPGCMARFQVGSRSTNATIENWFKLVKVDDFLGEKYFRPDAFVIRHYKNLKGRQRRFTETYLSSTTPVSNKKLTKAQKNRVNRALNSGLRDNDADTSDSKEGQSLVTEKWGKRQKLSSSKRNKIGRFQQPPVKVLPEDLYKKNRTPSRASSISPSRSASLSPERRASRKKQTPSRAGSISPSRSTSLSPPRRKSMVKKVVCAEISEQAKITQNDASSYHVRGTKSYIQKKKKKKTTVRGNGLSFRRMLSMGRGIINLGNTCYLSATLQMLSGDTLIDNLLGFFKKRPRITSAKSGVESDSGCTVVQTVFDSKEALGIVQTFEELRKPTLTGEGVNPENVMNFLRKQNSKFVPGTQQDAQESLTILLDSFFSKLPDKEITFEGDFQHIQTCLYCNKQKKNHAEPFFILALPVSHDANALQHCLDAFFEDEVLDAVFCEVCGKRRQTGRSVRILRPPQTLIIVLKRYDNRGTKTCTEIALPRSLDATGYIQEIFPDHKDRNTYKLKSLVLHHGNSMTTGHYTALVRSKGGSWTHFDDKAVDCKRETYIDTQFVKRNSYILQYKRAKEKTAGIVLTEMTQRVEVKETAEERKVTDMIKQSIEEIMTRDKQEIVFYHDDLVCSIRDLGTIVGENWLNDKVINAYLKLVEKEANENGVKAMAVDSFFIPRLRREKRAFIKELWTEGSNRHPFFDQEIILIPVNHEKHWTLVEINVANKTICHWDSLTGKPNKDTVAEVMNMLCIAHASQKDVVMDLKNWTLLIPDKDIPLQRNTNDCGVFLCKFAQYKALRRTIDFSHNDMAYFRSTMIEELLEGSLR